MKPRTATSIALVIVLGLIYAAHALGRTETRSQRFSLLADLEEYAFHANQLFRAVDKPAHWPLSVPSVVSHRLIACGNDCQTATGESLIDVWLNMNLSARAMQALHRDELVAVAAELGLPAHRAVVLTSMEITSVQQLAENARNNLNGTSTTPKNWREDDHGHEYGWSLIGVCEYLGPTAWVSSTKRVTHIIDDMLEHGINRHTEAGTHEIEGLAWCLRSSKSVKLSAADKRTYERLNDFLQIEIEVTLSNMRADGQLFADNESFLTCNTQRAFCDPLTALVRQTHFFEWISLLPHVRWADPRIELALSRLKQLAAVATQAVQGQTFTVLEHRALIVSAASHAMHAVKRLNHALKQ